MADQGGEVPPLPTQELFSNLDALMQSPEQLDYERAKLRVRAWAQVGVAALKSDARFTEHLTTFRALVTNSGSLRALIIGAGPGGLMPRPAMAYPPGVYAAGPHHD